MSIDTAGVAWNSLGVSFPDNWNFSAPAFQQIIRPFYLESASDAENLVTQTIMDCDYCDVTGRGVLGTRAECLTLTSTATGFPAADEKSASLLESLHKSGFGLRLAGQQLGIRECASRQRRHDNAGCV